MFEAPPTIVTVAEQHTAVIRLDIARSAMQAEMGPAIGELMRELAAQQLRPAGPLFSRHFAMHPDRFSFEVGVPVAATVAPGRRMQASTLPAGRVARAVLEGDYAGLANGWAGLLGWVQAHGFATRPDFWEVYVTGPEASPDPAAWRTQLNKPLKEL